MNTHRLTQARRLFTYDLAPRYIQRQNMRKWVMSIRSLGDRWLLAKQVGRTS